MTKTSNRTYTTEFKNQAINLALRSDSAKDTATRLGIPEGTLTTWLRRAKSDSTNDQDTTKINLNEELQRQECLFFLV